MKMSKEAYQSLKADLEKLATELFKFPLGDFATLSDSQLWTLCHEVNAQRSYGDTHPRWQPNALRRVLEPSHVEDQAWLTSLYNTESLEDSHLLTALRTAAKELSSNGKATPDQAPTE